MKLENFTQNAEVNLIFIASLNASCLLITVPSPTTSNLVDDEALLYALWGLEGDAGADLVVVNGTAIKPPERQSCMKNKRCSIQPTFNSSSMLVNFLNSMQLGRKVRAPIFAINHIAQSYCGLWLFICLRPFY